MQHHNANEMRQDLIHQIEEVGNIIVQLRIQIDLKVENLENLDPEYLTILADLRRYLQYSENILLEMNESLQHLDELIAENNRVVQQQEA